MDCPSEEQLIRMHLSRFKDISLLEFNIPGRELYVYHNLLPEIIFNSLEELQLNTRLVTTETNVTLPDNNMQSVEKNLLIKILLINFFFFVIEGAFASFSGSMGLLGDSLDMLADSFVYGMALFAVSKGSMYKNKVAAVSGYLQLALAIAGISEVLHRFLHPKEDPEYLLMIVISIFALIGNSACLILLQKSRSKESHIQASLIFTSNDVLINIGVIVAGVLVHYFSSPLPDLIIGSVIFILVVAGSFRILKLSRQK